MTEQDKKGGLLSFLTKPAVSIAAGTLLVVGFIVGILFWGGFNWSMEMTNNEEFCISCHEMEANVYEEYRDTIHYANALVYGQPVLTAMFQKSGITRSFVRSRRPKSSIITLLASWTPRRSLKANVLNWQPMFGKP